MYVVDYVRSRGVWFETLLHRPASSSTKRARSAHVPGRSVAKAVLIKAGETFLVAVLPSTSRIDLGRLSEVVGAPASQIRLGTSDELCELFPDCEPGVVPPFGRLYGLTTVLDARMAESPEIIIVANTRHEGLRIRFRDFATLEEPVPASFSRPICPDPDGSIISSTSSVTTWHRRDARTRPAS
jgi:Ala-tRNA(Pro) deacylase